MKRDVCTAAIEHGKLVLVVAAKPGIADAEMQSTDSLSDSGNCIVGILRCKKI